MLFKISASATDRSINTRQLSIGGETPAHWLELGQHKQVGTRPLWQRPVLVGSPDPASCIKRSPRHRFFSILLNGELVNKEPLLEQPPQHRSAGYQ